MESLKPGGLSSVQDIFFNSIETVSRDASLERRSRIPVRRDSSSPPSLPSSGRSTPVYRPPMQREGSSPPGLLSHHMPRPAIAPKPKLGQKQGNDSTGGHQSILGGPQSVLGGSQSVLGGHIGPFSRIPRPEAKMRKWESTSKLEMKRTASDLNDSSLRKRALQQTSSVNLQRMSGSVTNLSRGSSGSATNLSRGSSGSASNLRAAPPFTRSVSASFASLTRSSSNSSFSTLDFHKNKQIKSDESKSVSRRLSKRDEEVERLKDELNQSLELIHGLRGEVEQKENIAKIAVDNKILTPDYETMYRNLDKEHSKLAGQAKEMAWKMKKMETELKDARDTSDLLEFRLLELEQRESRERTPELGRKEEKDSISIHSGNVDSGCSSQTTLEDIIETHRDFRNEKIQDTKLKLHELMKHIPEPGGKSLLLQTVALFETLLARIKLMKEENQELQGEKMNLEKIKKDQDDLLSSMSKEQQREESRAIQAELELRNTCEEVEELKVRLITTQQQLEQSRMERDKLHTVKKQIEERQDKICSDLRRENDQSLQKLEIERQGFKAEQQMYQDVLERYSHQERIIKEQHSRLDEQENRMKEQEVKKIEEGGYRKGNRRESVESGDFNSKVSSKETSSGVSSDISDSESSDLDLHHHSHHSQRLYQQKVDYKEAEEQMEESGIFEQTSDSSLLLESNTEKSLLREQEEKKEKEDKEEREEEKEEEKVQDSVKGRNIVELELEINNFSRLEPQIDEDREEEYNEQLSDRSSQQKSSLDKFGSCEELKRINSTRMEVQIMEEGEEIEKTQRMEETKMMEETQRKELMNLTTRLKDMEEKWEMLYQQHQQVVEERCELEEAENDSRLKAQTLEMQYAGALERSQIIKDELIHERQSSEDLRMQLEDALSREERNMEDMEAIQMHLQEQEQLIRELEEREAIYAEQLRMLDMGLKISSWWRAWSWILLQQSENDTTEQQNIDEEQVHRDLLSSEQVQQKNKLSPDEDQEQEHVLLQLEYENNLAMNFKLREDELYRQLENIELEFESFLDELVTILFGHVQVNNKREEVVYRVRALLEAETNLRKQISDLEKKESVYSKTIQDADTIMARVEFNYQEQIRGLEQEKHELKGALWSIEQKKKNKNLEEAENKDEMNIIRNLEAKLAAVEESEAKLRTTVEALETCQIQLREKLEEKEQTNLDIKSELKDVCELRELVDGLKMEREKMKEEKMNLKQEVNRLKEVENILAQLRRSEEELRRKLQILEEERKEMKKEDEKIKEEEKEIMTKDEDRINIVMKKENRKRKEGDGEEERIECSDKIRIRNIDGEKLRKKNTLRLQIKSLESFETESRTSDLESSERSDPMTVSRGNSTERELSEEPLLRSRQDSGHHEFRSSQERSVPASRDGAGSPDFRSELILEGDSPSWGTLKNTNTDLKNKLKLVQAEISLYTARISDLEKSSETSLVQWNLVLAERESEIKSLREQISDLEQRIQLCFHCSLSYIDRATDRSSWDRDSSLVRSCSIDCSEVTEIEQPVFEETDFNDISKSQALPSQVCNVCRGSMEEKLNSISSQLQALTNILVGDMKTLATAHPNPKPNPGQGASINLSNFCPVENLTDVENIQMIESAPASNNCVLQPLHGAKPTGNLVTRIHIEGGNNEIVSPRATIPEPCSSARSGSFEPFPHPFSSTEFSVSQLYTAPGAPNQTLDQIAQISQTLEKICQIRSSSSISEVCSSANDDSENESEPASPDIPGDRFEPNEPWTNIIRLNSGLGITSVSVERDNDGKVLKLIRQDGLYSPTTIFQRYPSSHTYPFSSGDNLEPFSQSEDGRERNHNKGSQTENETKDILIRSLIQGKEKDEKEEKDEKDEKVETEEKVEKKDEEGLMRRLVEEKERLVAELKNGLKEKDRLVSNLQTQLQVSQSRAEEFKLTVEEQMVEMRMLGRQIDGLLRDKETYKIVQGREGGEDEVDGVEKVGDGGKQERRFIIRDLQCQLQSIKEKNTKKDSLIRKMAELISSQPESRKLISTIRESTVKPSDRRIDFDVETLCSFIETRRTSVSKTR